ncbi:hypothetical protein [Photobacterium lutimaris]|uniref:hypothetical protein n=1 Tax=Photobacterium lutimaris TaxID=388278 RepID=UPI0014151DB5|nr:hypothetical protein [Photobacterium lutimaris]
MDTAGDQDDCRQDEQEPFRMKAGTPPGRMRESYKDNATGQGSTKDNPGMGFRDYR